MALIPGCACRADRRAWLWSLRRHRAIPLSCATGPSRHCRRQRMYNPLFPWHDVVSPSQGRTVFGLETHRVLAQTPCGESIEDTRDRPTERIMSWDTAGLFFWGMHLCGLVFVGRFTKPIRRIWPSAVRHTPRKGCAPRGSIRAPPLLFPRPSWGRSPFRQMHACLSILANDQKERDRHRRHVCLSFHGPSATTIRWSCGLDGPYWHRR